MKPLFTLSAISLFASFALTQQQEHVITIGTGQLGGGKAEIRSTDSWKRNGTASQSVSQQHVFEIVFSGCIHQSVPSARPGYYDTTDISLCVPDNVNFGKVGTYVPTVGTIPENVPGYPNPVTVMMYGPFDDGRVPVHLPTLTPGSFVLAPRQFTVYRRVYSVGWVWIPGSAPGRQQQSVPPPGGGHWEQRVTISYDKANFALDKLFCSDLGTGIDTRKSYGQPNTEGQIPADPNSEFRYANFSSWIFKGGLFVGNMPFSTGDRSGLSRAQFRTTSSSTAGPLWDAVLSLYYLGVPSNADGSITLGAYIPAQTDPNLTISELLSTWQNKWNINPVDPGGLPPAQYDWTQHPVTKIAFTPTSPAPEYACWGLRPSSLYPTPWTYKHVCLAVDNETNLNLSSFTAWRYFASRWYHANHPDPSIAKDWEPRIWTLVKLNETAWP